MKKNKGNSQSNLINSDNVNQDIRDLFGLSFTTYKMSENYKLIYKNDPTCSIPKRLIELYTKYIKPDYNSMIYSFERKYISNESLIEKNNNREQMQGLRAVYDYIQKYDINKGQLDIFISSLEIHALLWKATDEKNNKEMVREQERIRSDIEKLKEEARIEKDLSKFKRARKLEKDLSAFTYKSRIGGKLRSDNYNDNVDMFDIDIEVPSAKESLEFMNSYISAKKKDEFNKVRSDSNIINYIAYCVKEVTNLIYYQPFIDGNKRTFRALLNLMFKVRGLPPVYVKSSEKEEYKNALFLAMKDKDYSEIIGFYLFKICDSIYELDVMPYQQKRLEFYNKETDYGHIGRKK